MRKEDSVYKKRNRKKYEDVWGICFRMYLYGPNYTLNLIFFSSKQRDLQVEV